MSDERSESGAPIFRHGEADFRDLEPSAGDADLIDAVSAHVEGHLGPVDSVWHEIIPDVVHVDVLPVAPTEARPCWTLVTCGMAERPMTTPEGAEEFRFAELMIALPPEWPGPGDPAFEDEQHYWPVRLLKDLAKLPHQFGTWLWSEHTVPNGDPPEPYAEGTGLCCAMLLPPLNVPDGFRILERPGTGDVHFLAVVPLHRDEMELKLRKGSDALFDPFQRAGVTELLDPGRGSVAKRKRFGLF